MPTFGDTPAARRPGPSGRFGVNAFVPGWESRGAQSAPLARCRRDRRRSPDRAESSRSARAARTSPHAPKPTLISTRWSGNSP